MVNIDTRLPLMVQQPNILAALDSGTRAAGNANNFLRQVEGQNLFRQHGAGAMQGQQAALNALAGYDPSMALNMRTTQNEDRRAETRLGMDQERLQMARDQIARGLAEAEDQAEAAREAREAVRLGNQAFAAWQSGDEARWRQITGLIGMDLPMSEEGVAALGAVVQGASAYEAWRGAQGQAGYRQVRGAELGMTGPNADRLFNVAPNGQVTNIGGQDAGTRLSVGPDGTVTLDQGGLAGGVVDRANLRAGSGEARIADPSSPTGTAIVAEPGGEAAREQAERERAAGAAAENERVRSDVVARTTKGIRDALKKNGIFDILPEAGVVGSRLAKWGVNQEAVDVAKRIDTLQGMVAFDRLEKMKAASATGASGLGQVTEREISLLAAQLGALSNETSDELILETLDTVDRVFGKLSPEAQAYLLGETDAEPWSGAPTGGLDPDLQAIFDLYSQPTSR